MEAGLTESSISAPERLERAYEEHKDRLVTFAAAFLGDRGLAEDVVHDVFAALAKKPQRIGSLSNLAGYLTVSARNRAITLLQKRKRRRLLSETGDETGPCAGNDPADCVERVETNGALLGLVGDLPLELREVLALRIWGEASFSEIAKMQGIAKSTAHTRYVQALDRLRLALKASENHE